MAFKKSEGSSSGSIPFFSEWIKELSETDASFYDDKFITPKHIKSVQSGKGYMLNFDDAFTLFLWKGSSIGQAIKKMIRDEQGYLLLLRFYQGKKKFDYELGFEDEAEVTVTEDKFEEGMFYCEISNDFKLPIAPSDHRKYDTDLPMTDPKSPVKFTPTPKAINKHKQRSDGE